VRSASSSRGGASVFLLRAIAAVAGDAAARIEQGKKVERVRRSLRSVRPNCFFFNPIFEKYLRLDPQKFYMQFWTRYSAP
jgi:hypothetical protein